MATCSKCTNEATYVYKSRRLCDIHYRFNQMRQDSWLRRKRRHTNEELQALIPEDMKCPRCKVDMIWRKKHGEKNIVNQITLQHWNDGTISFLCHRCNTQHGSMDDHSFRLTDPDHKFCPHCKTIKHESEFGLKNARCLLKRNSYCKPCNAIRSKETKKKMDKEKINAYQRAYRASRKASGNPIKRKK